MSLSLRAAEPRDAARVADILIASRRQFLPYAPSAHSEAAMRRWVADVLLASEGVTVAVRGGEVVGVLATSMADERHWIDQMYLDPLHVGRGIGTALLAHALATLPRPIRLYTFQQNEGARRFYERHGFRVVEFGDGSGNEERCPDVLYELGADAGR